MRMPVPTEEQEGTWLLEWAHLALCPNGNRVSKYLIHIPNGAFFGRDRKTAAITMRKLRAQGLKVGCSDYFFAYPANREHGLWIELKRLKASPSAVDEEQALFHVDMRRQGYATRIARGWAEARFQITEYLGATYPIENRKPEVSHGPESE